MTVETLHPRVSAHPPAESPPLDLERGWRYLRVVGPDGREESKLVLLTPEDYLNPQEGDIMPHHPLHSQVTHDLVGILRARYAGRPEITVFEDLIVEWGIPGLPNPSPDVFVVLNVRDPASVGGKFYVQQEHTRPALAIEVLSTHYVKEDRKDKVRIYERAGVREYVILDPQGLTADPVLGYRLEGRRYRPIPLDEDGFVYCETVDLRFGLDNQGRAVVEDGASGERLLRPDELETYAREQAARAEAEAAARARAEARLVALEAELRRLRGAGTPN